MDKPIELIEVARAAAELRKAAEQIEVLLGAAAHLEPDEKRRLVRAAYRTSERVVRESDDLAILLFKPDLEECFS